ncbi:hypothetical protein MMC11_000221 [Xylographa trunciseda]|nr:hypothetical protein [Xylographa trunciseda]
MAIKNRFYASHQALRLVAFQNFEAMGEPLEGETPYQHLTEEEVLAEDAARKVGMGAANVELGGDEVMEGKGKGKEVLVEEGEAEGPPLYDEESDWDRRRPEPVSIDEETDEEMEEL